MGSIIYHLRDFGMNECVLRAQNHADKVADMTKWTGQWFGFTSHLLRGFLWAFLGETCLFIANGILYKLLRLTQ